MVEKRLAVTLTSGRSHILDVPANVEVEAAAAVLVGDREGRHLGWDAGDREWLPLHQGQSWIRRSAISEVAVVDFADEPDVIYGEG